ESYTLFSVTVFLASSSYLYLISTSLPFLFFFFFNDTATTEIYTLSLHDALPIFRQSHQQLTAMRSLLQARERFPRGFCRLLWRRSEEHTSELQSLTNLVCRLLLEKKKKNRNTLIHYKARVQYITQLLTRYKDQSI